MKAEEMWQVFKQYYPTVKQDLDSWAFGSEQADELAHLVYCGEKTATCSGYDLYQNEPLPQADDYSVLINSQAEAICVIQTKKVSLRAFKDIDEAFAYKEGEGDKSLMYWKKTHYDFFAPYYEELGLTFTEDSLLVCEEFEVVFPLPIL